MASNNVEQQLQGIGPRARQKVEDTAALVEQVSQAIRDSCLERGHGPDVGITALVMAAAGIALANSREREFLSAVAVCLRRIEHQADGRPKH